jgi:hypothetical protein
VELYLHSPYTPSWRGAQLKKHGDYFTVSYKLYEISKKKSGEIFIKGFKETFKHKPHLKLFQYGM